jgi:hypothetical protein
MRVAEQEYMGLFVGTQGLEVVPVNLETVAIEGEPQNAFCYLAAVVLNAAEKTIIVWRQDYHPFARHGQRLDGYRHGRYHACGV